MNESISVEKTIKLISQKLNGTNGREIYQASLRRFLDLFGIDYFQYIEREKKWEHWRSGLKLELSFVKFLIENVEIISDFDTDFYKYKTYKEIAAKIGTDPTKTKQTILQLIYSQQLLDYLNFSDVFKNIKDLNENTVLKLISSYQIQMAITGKLPELKSWDLIDDLILTAPNKLNQLSDGDVEEPPRFKKPKTFSDVFDYIIEELQPIYDPESSKEWGLSQPGGVLLYGSP